MPSFKVKFHIDGTVEVEADDAESAAQRVEGMDFDQLIFEGSVYDLEISDTVEVGA